ncbi:MAG: LacI family transcriptional regulator [Butyrivibrio sp.]|nr:LacI family transcriptional regulator [Butyrivibrio sp.]
MAEITIKEVAQKCGVGVSTVSRALNNHSDINPETKARIMKVIEETGYIPNNSARNLKRTDSKTIAVLIKGITNPFFSPAIEVIEDETRRKKYTMVLRHVGAYEDEVDVALELEKERRLRGIIFLGGGFRKSTEKLKSLNVPVVFSTIGAPLLDNESKAVFSTVSVDDMLESKRMLEHVIGLGHRKIAIITEGSEELSVGQLRLQGYIEALKAAKIKVDEDLIRFVNPNLEHYSVENGYRTTKNLIATGKEFTALFCVSDMLAIGACRALTDAGYKIPKDVSVCGFDGLGLGQYVTPRLTTMRQPMMEISRQSIGTLFDIIDEVSEHKHITLACELIQGESVWKPKGSRK